MDHASLTSFEEDCLLLEEAVTTPDRLRIKSAVVVCRRWLLDASPMIHHVRRQLGIRERLEFRVGPDLLGIDIATIFGLKTKPAMQLSLMPDGLSPDGALPGASQRTLTLDQFLAHRVAVHNDEKISVKDVIQFLAEQEGAVHYDTRLSPEEEKLRALNRSMQVMSLDVLMSCIRGIVRVLLATVVPIRIEILRHHVCQPGTRPVPRSHLELTKLLARELYRRRDWESTKRLLLSLVETSAISSPPNPSFEDHMTILYQWGNLHLMDAHALERLLWMRDFARSAAARLKPDDVLAGRALVVLCTPILPIAATTGAEAVVADIEDQLRSVYATDPAWHYWAQTFAPEVLARWSASQQTPSA